MVFLLPGCSYLAQANVGHLILVLVDGSSQAAVKQLHSSAQCSLLRHNQQLNT